MDSRSAGVVFATLAGTGLLFTSGSAQAQLVQQVLDRVTVYSGDTALEMRFDDPAARPPDFTDFGLTAATA